MNIITALNSNDINKKLMENKNINIICNDIQYKEGILEKLEENNNIQYIIIKENLSGQIETNELINKINSINNKIKIIIIKNKKEIKKYNIKEKNIYYIYTEKIKINQILKIINKRNKIVGILGNRGSGKTITILILSQILIKNKNVKILILEDNINNNSIKNTYLKNKSNKINKLKNKLYIFNIKNILNNKDKIINKIKSLKKDFDYIFIDIQNIYSYKIYENILDNKLLILEPNIIELNKILKNIFKLKNVKLILNKINNNSISEKLLKKIFNNKIEIIGKIKNNKNYNLIINNNLNIKYLDKKTKKEYIKIINKIEEV